MFVRFSLEQKKKRIFGVRVIQICINSLQHCLVYNWDATEQFFRINQIPDIFSNYALLFLQYEFWYLSNPNPDISLIWILVFLQSESWYFSDLNPDISPIQILIHKKSNPGKSSSTQKKTKLCFLREIDTSPTISTKSKCYLSYNAEKRNIL